MDTEVRCFWLERSGQTRVSLRRYNRRKCAAGLAFCNASFPLTIIPDEDTQPSGDSWPHDDNRWPTRCASCGYPFHEDDHWQLNHVPLYQDPDGQLMTVREAPPGAMWDANWYEGIREPGPDGKWLMVRLPDGKDWYVDGNANGHPEHVASWTRSGDVPVVTVRPSVNTGEWHGWLVDGVLKKVG